jgi:hypothetical protein
MRQLWIYGRRLLEWLLFWAIGHGVILFLASREIYPDKLVASLITESTEAPIWADWIMSGAFGLLITFIVEIFLWNRRPSSWLIANTKYLVMSEETRAIRSEQKLDFTAWDRVLVFTIRQAAQLWSEERPTRQGQLSQFAEIVQRELIEAGNQNKLIIEAPPPMPDLLRMLLLAVAATGKTLSKTSDSEVTRENLCAYALSKNERPLFLFPENR